MRLATIILGLATAALVFANTTARYANPVDLRVSLDGRRLYIVCQGSDELTVVDAAAKAVIGRIPVGRAPRGIALTKDGKRAYVTNSWSDTVTEIDTAAQRAIRTLPAGFEPSGAALDSNGTSLFVANRIGNDISVVDLESGKETRRLVAGRGPSYMAASADGARIYATHIYPNIGKFRSEPESEITEIDAAHQIVASRARLRNVAGVFQIAISQDGRLGIATQMRPKNLVPLAHVEHGWAFGDSLAVFGEDVGGRVVQMPLDELERYFSLPFGIAIAPDKSKIYLSASSSDEVAVIDAKRLIETALDPNAATFANNLSISARYVFAHIHVGRNPRGIALSPDGAILYVCNRLDDTVSIIDTAHRQVTGVIPLGGPETITPERHGERLFYSSRPSFQGQFGCANCHLDSTIDGLQWDLEPDGFGKDIVDNRSLEDIGETAPYKWNGSNPDLQTECGPRTERFFFRSAGFTGQDLEDLVRYVKSIPLRPNRYRPATGELTGSQEHGKTIFERTRRADGSLIPEELRCSFCHSGKFYTNKQVFDVGSGKPTDREPLVDTPQLTNVALTAPYLHDGSARTLEEIWTVFNPKDTHGVTNDLTKDELNDLIEYLKTL